jgi:chromosome segregation ATPase
VQNPESVPRLFDLIVTKNEKIKLAFYFALRDCLVTASLEQAIRLAYGEKNCKKHKVVTLTGILIQESGTITGGGDNITHGRMQLKGYASFPLKNYEVLRNNLTDVISMTETLQTTINRINLKFWVLSAFTVKHKRSQNRILELLSVISLKNNLEVAKLTNFFHYHKPISKKINTSWNNEKICKQFQVLKVLKYQVGYIIVSLNNVKYKVRMFCDVFERIPALQLF